MDGYRIAYNLFNEAKRYIPGGVNSPVRAFRSVGGVPVFVRKAKGSKIYGECGREFIDYCMSWGALILGHAYPEIIKEIKKAIEHGTSFGTATRLEIEFAKLVIEAVPSIEKLRLVNSGTEAIMSAVRLARAYTGRDKIIKFEGAYHGHADYLLVRSGSGQLTFGLPTSKGIPESFIKHTVVIPYNNKEILGNVIKREYRNIACVIIEPVMANCGIILPENGFLQFVRDITKRYGIILIFDEVITGFRLSYHGAQGYFGIYPDLTCLGKIIGGGFPIGAFGGRSDIMDLLSPAGEVYQAGTLAGNPVGVRAGLATLKFLKKKKRDIYKNLSKKVKFIYFYTEKIAKKRCIKLEINHIASMFSISFTDRRITDCETAKMQNQNLFRRFYHNMLKYGMYLSPSPFEANFLSLGHSDSDIKKTLRALDMALEGLIFKRG